MIDPVIVVETGWLLDDGHLCIGRAHHGLGLSMVTYTDPTAIRFARQQDAENMKAALSLRGSPVEHQWG